MQPYQTLGISEGATFDEIRAAYRQRIKEVHPDQGGSQEEFKKVKQAYDRLVEVEHRRHKAPPSQADTKEVSEATVEFLNYEFVNQKGKTSHEEIVSVFAELSENPSDVSDWAYGSFTVKETETVLEAAERVGYVWPFSCRGGACANCAVQLVEGEMTTPNYMILPEELLKAGFRLSCIGQPTTEDLRILYNVKERDEVIDLLLPSRSDF